ncbi:MAG: hypothetical protein JST39_21710 [Bacteroidetes bacterium]|nr:hypothetical protein [Bacteroidota bacterium]
MASATKPGGKPGKRFITYINKQTTLSALFVTVVGGIIVAYLTNKPTPAPAQYNQTNQKIEQFSSPPAISVPGTDSGARRSSTSEHPAPKENNPAPRNENKIVVLAANGGNLEPKWADKLKSWLSIPGYAITPSLNRSAMTPAVVGMIAGGDAAAIRKANATEHAAYFCVLNYETHNPEKDKDGFHSIQLSADLIVFETTTGDKKYYLHKDYETYSGASPESALKRAEDSLLAYINRKPFNLTP